MITIREEKPEDIQSIHKVNLAAFKQPAEATLVDALRKQCAIVNSLVAEDLESGDLIGHLTISPITIEGEKTYQAVGLGPMAVLPARQRKGVGSQLINYWFDCCAKESQLAIVVLGHPEFYPRFGFKPAYLNHISCEYEVPKEVFMVKELKPGALESINGLVKYHSAFAEL